MLDNDDHLYSGSSMTLSIDWDARVQHLYFLRDEEYKMDEVSRLIGWRFDVIGNHIPYIACVGR